MKRLGKICVIFCALLFIGLTPATGINKISRVQHEETSEGYDTILIGDALIAPDIVQARTTRSPGPEPGFYDTSEYMIGSVAVGVIFLESNGSIDPSTEDWNATEETKVEAEINQALNWWTAQNASAGVSFTLDIHKKVNISYEPINHPSGMTTNAFEQLWVSESMAQLGYTTGNWMRRTREYINALRNSKKTNWAYTIFVVDSSNDIDNCFTDGNFSYAYLGGPFVVLVYGNNGWGVDFLNNVTAHETGHIFYATDEYNGRPENSGYLNAADVEGSHCLMDTNNLCLSAGTKLQIGWRDTDADNIHDIVDTHPNTTLNPYTPDPTNDHTPTYNGSATVVPYPNNNPRGPRNNVTINTISNVQYRVDGGAWIDATAQDGTFNGPKENFTFTTAPLSAGNHTIEARATNSVGNVDLTPSSDNLTVLNNPPAKPTITGPALGYIKKPYSYTAVTTDPDGDQVSYIIDWNDGTNTGWSGFAPSGTAFDATHTWIDTSHVVTGDDLYWVTAQAKDTHGALSEWSDPYLVLMTIPCDFNFDCSVNLLDFTIFAQAYNTKMGDPNYDADCDLTDNGFINIIDFTIFARWYGKTCWNY